ncbi:MAG TPA: 5-dehydro-4-deoxy-D-glucuronate isomerase [Gemmatimonadaceae bacterium]
MHYLPDAERTKHLTTEELRSGFLVQGLFTPGMITLRHIDLDRVVLGGAVPTNTPLLLEAPESLRAEYFTERRELGVLNVGGRGAISVEGKRYAMEYRDVLYVGRGSRQVQFESDDAARSARFYLVSYPAHATHPTTHASHAAAEVTEVGSSERANQRKIAKYIHAAGVKSAQLGMGVTELMPGSVWNTMPSHRHHRRTEVYLYFGLPDDAVVVHLMGAPSETRHLVMRNEEVALSPAWSIHSGCGTASYTFCWAMGGENQDYTDMQSVDMGELK